MSGSIEAEPNGATRAEIASRFIAQGWEATEIARGNWSVRRGTSELVVSLRPRHDQPVAVRGILDDPVCEGPEICEIIESACRGLTARWFDETGEMIGAVSLSVTIDLRAAQLSTDEVNRQARVADFQQRATDAPQSVCHHPSGGWPYIPVNPFADETDAPVLSVDCWCRVDSDAALLECVLHRPLGRKPGLFARLDADAPCWPKLHAVLEVPLTRQVVEDAIQQFVMLGFPHKLLATLLPGKRLVRVNLDDLAE